jgi:predicted amidophosphoribosyltransferase
MKTLNGRIRVIIGQFSMGSGPKCVRCGKPISYGNIYCKACGGTGVILIEENI